MGLKIQSMKQLKAEMLAVAKGTRQPPVDAGQMSFDSVEAVMRLLTPDNRQLLGDREQQAGIGCRPCAPGRPRGVECQPHAEPVGCRRFRAPQAGRRQGKVPEVAIHRLTVDIDVCRSRISGGGLSGDAP